MPELAACQSAQVQAVLARQAWARRLRRLFRHGPFHGLFGSALLGLFHEQVASGVQLVGLFNGLAEIVVAACTKLTPSGAPDPVFVAQVRERLAPPCFVHDHVVERAVEDGAGKSGARLRLDAALEAAEDGHVAWLQVGRASWRGQAQYDV